MKVLLVVNHFQETSSEGAPAQPFADRRLELKYYDRRYLDKHLPDSTASVLLSESPAEENLTGSQQHCSRMKPLTQQTVDLLLIIQENVLEMKESYPSTLCQLNASVKRHMEELT